MGAEASPAWKGAEQGIIEANILGRFTGQGYELKKSSASAVPRGAAAVIVAAGGAAAAGISDFRKILEQVETKSALRRNVTLDDVGNAAAFLCSDFAAGITGEVIHVDAGFSVMGMSMP